MIGARNIGGRPKIVRPGEVENTWDGDDLVNSPDYQKPYINDDAHPIHRGTYSPDLVKETNKAQNATSVQQFSPFIAKEFNAVGNESDTSANMRQTETPPAIDPLTGNPVGYQEPDKPSDAQRSDLLRASWVQTAALQSILTELRTASPQIRCKIKGDSTLSASAPSAYKFEIGDKTVPALRLLIQNNTAATIYIDLDGQAGFGTIQILAGGMFSSTTKCNTLNIFSTLASTVNGTAVGGIVVRGWSNPEWASVRGQA